MNITVKHCDLFKSGRNVLVHCISRDCAMGAGIAKTFNRKYPQMKNTILAFMNQEHLSYPTAVEYKANDTVVINMVTKPRYFNKPTYDTFRRSLEVVKKICIKNGYTEIAMPKIGCGLDKLCWSRVSGIIYSVFKDTDIDILICVK